MGVGTENGLENEKGLRLRWYLGDSGDIAGDYEWEICRVMIMFYSVPREREYEVFIVKYSSRKLSTG